MGEKERKRERGCVCDRERKIEKRGERFGERGSEKTNITVTPIG